MSGLPAPVERARQRLREQAELHLRLAAMDDLRRRHPGATTAPHRSRGGAFWRFVFVPVYRRLPWEAKVRAMHAMRMTAESHGWTPPPRRAGEPWRPPPPPAGTARAGTAASSDGQGP
jgi:hypothetical protein